MYMYVYVNVSSYASDSLLGTQLLYVCSTLTNNQLFVENHVKRKQIAEHLWTNQRRVLPLWKQRR